ncbi:MAG: hypothetical protein QM742_09700 [Aquabacterium sp.]
MSAGLLAILVVLSIRAAGDLTYSLDDPYIHLALARLIQQGSYGINPGEWASPSSSVLWPFLLALAPARWLEWAPLALNALACLLSVQVLRKVLEEAGLPSWVQVLGSVVLGFGLNLFGLAMTGMEHSLQVLLVWVIAWRMVAQRYDGLFYVALCLAPLVRYECLAISLPCAAWAWRSGDKVRPVVCVGLLLAVLAAFSFTLHGWGLPWLPASVLAKSGDRSLLVNVKLQLGVARAAGMAGRRALASGPMAALCVADAGPHAGLRAGRSCGLVRTLRGLHGRLAGGVCAGGPAASGRGQRAGFSAPAVALAGGGARGVVPGAERCLLQALDQHAVHADGLGQHRAAAGGDGASGTRTQ